MIPIQDKGEEKPRCNYELFVEEHLKLPPGINEYTKIDIDYGQLVGLVCYACEKGITNSSIKNKGESRELFEWMKASEELPEENVSVCIRAYGKIGHGMYVINKGKPYFWYNTYKDGNSNFYPEYFERIEWLKSIQSSLKQEKVFFIDEVRELIDQYGYSEMSIGKLTEILNEKCSGQSSLTPKSIRDSEFKEWFFENCVVNTGTIAEPVERSIDPYTMYVKLTSYFSKSASLKPNKLSDSEIEKMAEEYAKKPGFTGLGTPKNAFIAGCKAILNK